MREKVTICLVISNTLAALDHEGQPRSRVPAV
jgi:hypothetical protein